MALVQSHATRSLTNTPLCQQVLTFMHILVALRYLSWPDHGVPDSPTQFMRMLKIVRETVRVKDAPMVVHCSAGCGRTGTLAAIDDVWSQLEARHLVTHPFISPFLLDPIKQYIVLLLLFYFMSLLVVLVALLLHALIPRAFVCATPQAGGTAECTV